MGSNIRFSLLIKIILVIGLFVLVSVIIFFNISDLSLGKLIIKTPNTFCTLQSKKLSLFALKQEIPAKYHSLLCNNKINNSLIKGGTLNNQELLYLKTKILELEAQEKTNWNGDRYLDPIESSDERRFWLKQVALNLYLEANKKLQWSILSYTQANLNHLLAYDRNSIFLEAIRMNHNPFFSHKYGQSLENVYPDALENHQKFLNALIMKMRADDWMHVSGSETFWQQNCGIWNPDVQCMALMHKGASGLNASFIRSILASNNIPSQVITMWGHGGIIFPTMKIGMNGDSVQSGFSAGLILRPNTLPVKLTFTNLKLFQGWIALPQCKGSRELDRSTVLSYLNLYNQNAWNSDLIAAYQFTAGNTYQSGQWLREQILTGTFPYVCQTEDPLQANYWEPLLNEKEMSIWMKKIGEIAGR